MAALGGSVGATAGAGAAGAAAGAAGDIAGGAAAFCTNRSPRLARVSLTTTGWAREYRARMQEVAGGRA